MKHIALLGLGLGLSCSAFAQPFPSPTYNTLTLQTPLAVADGGTGVTSSTGTGPVVRGTNPTIGGLTLTAPLPVTSGGTGTASSTGTGSAVLSNGPTVTNINLTNASITGGSLVSVNLGLDTVTPTGGVQGTLESILSGGTYIPGMALGDSTIPRIGTFGPTAIMAAVRRENSVVGYTYNDAPAGTLTFPTGITGYGVMASPGGQAFGVFARADLMSPGTATNELNTFNYSGDPSPYLPPDESFGTTQNNAITAQLVPYGNYNSSIGLQFSPGVNDANTADLNWLTALYMRPNTFATYGIFLDSSATETGTGLVIKRGGGAEHIHLQSVGTSSPNSAIIDFQDTLGNAKFSVRQSGDTYLRAAYLSPFNYADLPAPTSQGGFAYCADCFVPPGNVTRGTLVFSNGISWLSVNASVPTY